MEEFIFLIFVISVQSVNPLLGEGVIQRDTREKKTSDELGGVGNENYAA